MELTTKVGNVHLSTPLLLGSGYITEDTYFFERSAPRGCAGLVTRSLKLNVPPERQHVPAPRYAMPSPHTMLNCEWGNEKHWSHWRDNGVRKVKDAGGAIIVSLSGRDIESCKTLITELDQQNPDAYEINISCSHSGELHGNLNLDVEHLKAALKAVRPLTNTPIWIKLSWSSILLKMAKTAEEYGADTIVCTNSIGPGLLLDTRTGKPMLGISGGAGGLTGEAIFPIALQCVYKLAKNLNIPIVGVGGVRTADEVVQMMMAGASAVQLYTEPALYGPRVFEQARDGLLTYLEANPEFTSIESIIRLTHQFREQHEYQAPEPVIIEESCTGCAECATSCAFGAISFRPRPGQKPLVVIGDSCNGCNACVAVCPPEYDALRLV